MVYHGVKPAIIPHNYRTMSLQKKAGKIRMRSLLMTEADQ